MFRSSDTKLYISFLSLHVIVSSYPVPAVGCAARLPAVGGLETYKKYVVGAFVGGGGESAVAGEAFSAIRGCLENTFTSA